MKFRLYLQECYCYFGRIQLSFYCFFLYSIWRVVSYSLFIVLNFSPVCSYTLPQSGWTISVLKRVGFLFFSLNSLIVRKMENFLGDISSSSVFDGDVKLSYWKCHYSTWTVNTNSINFFSSSSGEISVVRMSYVVLSHLWR